MKSALPQYAGTFINCILPFRDTANVLYVVKYFLTRYYFIIICLSHLIIIEIIIILINKYIGKLKSAHTLVKNVLLTNFHSGEIDKEFNNYYHNNMASQLHKFLATNITVLQ